MKQVKVVLIGAGSGSFGRGTIADLMSCDGLSDVDLTVALVDIDAEALEAMRGFAEAVREHYGREARIEALLLEPTVDDTRRARDMMEEMLWLQADYLPEFG